MQFFGCRPVLLNVMNIPEKVSASNFHFHVCALHLTTFIKHATRSQRHVLGRTKQVQYLGRQKNFLVILWYTLLHFGIPSDHFPPKILHTST
jgi:hypothetical protein